jgi:RNA polymerase sigma-70 factor, ECF subfamily
MPGRADALTELYGAHRAEVVRLCRHLLSSSDAAEDAAQEVFLRAHRHWNDFDASRPFLPWVMRIASRHCIDELRKRATERRLFGHEDVERLAAASERPGPLITLLASEGRCALAAEVSRLPDRYRVPLVLSVYRELDYDDIGAELGVPKSHVAVLIFRAKQLLRAALAPVGRSPRGSDAVS